VRNVDVLYFVEREQLLLLSEHQLDKILVYHFRWGHIKLNCTEQNRTSLKNGYVRFSEKYFMKSLLERNFPMSSFVITRRFFVPLSITYCYYITEDKR